MEDRRVVDYFVVAGLPNNPLPLEEYSNEAAIKPSFRQDPITDIAVVNKSVGEKVPKGFSVIERTASGFPADLNHGSLRCPEMYLCFRRSRDKPPLMDIGVLYEGKERVMAGCEVVHTTAHGNPANVNNSNSSRTYITYRRAQESTSSDSLVVVDICVILANKGEEPPLAYNRINKTLNKGMVGSDVYLCYKKAMTKTDVLAYQPGILGRYPLEDYENFPLPLSVPMFCLPMGATIECWSAKAQHPLPTCSTFILTGSAGEKVYGAAVTFYEEYPENMLTDLQMRSLGLKNKHIREQYRILKTVHANKCICLLSHWPFFDAFKKFLKYLYRVSITGPHTVPIERHISHFMFDVPYPSPQRPRILVQLNDEALSLCMPEDSPLPQSGASFIELLRNLGPENCLSMLAYVLCEHKILIHSLRPVVLTQVAEAVTMIIFPFHWQCPYIPLCPLGLSDVLNAPCPFVVGIDSRYFDMYDPPSDVICVDLDTIRIYMPEDKKNLNYKMLPKKPAKVLLETLDYLFNILSSPEGKVYITDEVSMEMTSIDSDFRLKKKKMMMEFQIQEAFLRFMCCLLKGYKSYLNPILQQPTLRTTDASSLFDMQGFLKSRDKAYAKFYNQMMKTQMFFRFIEERSFVSDKDAGLAFFDECLEKVDETKDEPKLIELDTTQTSERTVFIMPPEPTGLPEGMKYSYNGFPELKSELFLMKKQSMLAPPGKQSLCPSSPLARRTKQEIRSAQKQAQTQISNPKHWAKCLLSYSYTLWFIHLPAFVHFHQNKLEALKIAYAVLQKMHNAKLYHQDEVCYRVLMQLCGQYNKPGLAVKVFYQMKKNGVQPNAITYGYYNKVMLEAKWPSSKGPSPSTRGLILWGKLRHVIIGVAQFRKAVRRRSLSLCSNSGSEYDQISHTSVDSYLDDHGDKKAEITQNGEQKDVTKILVEERISNGGVSDRGYNSMTQEDAQELSQILNGAGSEEREVEIPPSSTSHQHPANGAAPSVAESAKETPKGRREFSSSVARLSFRRKGRSYTDHSHKDDGAHGNQSTFPGPEYAPFRSRIGSIVRKSPNTMGSSSSFETLKGSIIGSSAGLLMVSQSSLDNSVFLHNGDIAIDDLKRKRHKSAGEHHHLKTRSNSLFASWRPRHASGNGEDKISMRFSDLKRREEDDIVIEDSAGEKEKVKRDGMGPNGDRPENIKDSGVGLDDNHLADVEEVNESREEDQCNERNSSAIFKGAEILMPQLEEVCETTEVRENSSSSVGAAVLSRDEAGMAGGDAATISVPRVCVESSTPLTPVPDSEFDNDALCSVPVASSERTCGVISEDNDMGSSAVSECNSQTSTVSSNNGSATAPTLSVSAKKLLDIGRTSSSPDCLEAAEKDTSSIKTSRKASGPVEPAKLQSTLSLNESGKPERPTDFVLRRSQSLRRTNEAISGVLRFAARAAVSKFNELKQSITTPIKTGSNTSLSRSIEDKDSGTGDEESGSTVREKLKYGESQEYFSDSDTESDSSRRQSQASYGSAPSSSSFEKYLPALQDVGDDVKTPPFEKLCSIFTNIAMEVEISSCTRCHRCHSLLYDEEIMAGWFADDSNLNTSCPFCKAKLVPQLQIYVKDWRGKRRSELLCRDENPEGYVQENTNGQKSGGVGESSFLFGEERLKDVEESQPGMPNSPESMSEVAFRATSRRRCTSECYTNATETQSNSSLDSFDGNCLRTMRSPLSISIDEEEELPTCPSTWPEMKKDFIARTVSVGVNPIVIHYLSPLVLRKELEYVLEHEGDLCLASDRFVDEHPIIFWNLIWYFKRLDIPSHLPGYLLSAETINRDPEVPRNRGQYNNSHVLIRPMWDNTRIHNEVGMPMYIAWNKGHRSSVVDALITESQPFTKVNMHQIISNIQCSDVLTSMKLVMSGRKRVGLKRHHFRSMYREILFLSFIACGRENIDQDAYDREYAKAFEKLAQAEVRRLQHDDRPRSEAIFWCRKVFGELEV